MMSKKDKKTEILFSESSNPRLPQKYTSLLARSKTSNSPIKRTPANSPIERKIPSNSPVRKKPSNSPIERKIPSNSPVRKKPSNSPIERKIPSNSPVRKIPSNSPIERKIPSNSPIKRTYVNSPIKRKKPSNSPARRKSTSLPSRMSISSRSSRKSQFPSYNSGSRVFSNDIYKFQHKNLNVRKIQQFMKDKIIINKNTLKNRINRYKLLATRLSLVKDDDCLEEKTFKGDNGWDNGYTIRNIINLKKKIGSESKHGTIYLTHIPNLLGTYSIATKVMKINNGNNREVSIMKKITNDIILNKLSRHFLMIYCSSVCVQEIPEIPEKIKFMKVDELTDEDLEMLCKRRNIPRIPKNRRLISVNELADGDLQMLCKKRDILEDDELIFNLLFQVFISIATFQNSVGYMHNDTHFGNFLYQHNKEEGYYHYVFNGTNYYLKSCMYNIIIFDFGISTDINKENGVHNLCYDYERILNAFMKKGHGWGIYTDLPKDETNKKVIKIYNILRALAYMSNNFYRPYAKDFFAKIIETILLIYTPPDMFITERPSNVINNIPFII